MDLNQFIKWQAEKPRRSVRIEIEKKMLADENGIKAWVYDYDLMCGQYVSDVSEIDLEAKKKAKDEEALRELMKQYRELGERLAAQ